MTESCKWRKTLMAKVCAKFEVGSTFTGAAVAFRPVYCNGWFVLLAGGFCLCFPRYNAPR
jgi:hypothetical protein